MLEITAGRLSQPHLRALMALLERNPVETVYLRSELRLGMLSGTWWGVGSERELRGAALGGPLTVPWIPDTNDARVLAAALSRDLPRMIVGPQESVMALHSWLRPFRRPRQIRAPQPLMDVRMPVATVPDVPVRRATRDDLELLVVAAAAMHREEMGVDPMTIDPHAWRARMATLVDRGWSWVWIEKGEVVFKTELSAWTPECVQLQGVWVTPRRRRQGVAAAGLGHLVNRLLTETGSCSLYVNHYNSAALALYASLGFVQVAEFATVLY